MPQFFWITISVTRLGALLDFGQLLQPLASINLPKVSKSLIFLVKSFLDNFYRLLAIFFLVTLIIIPKLC